MLQGSIPRPTDRCTNETINIFTRDDHCSRGVQALLSGNESALIYLVDGDCPFQFHHFIEGCHDVIQSDEVSI